MKRFHILPSLLSADFSRLGDDVSRVIFAGADMIHFDVMDNHYVSNLTFGPMVLSSLRNYGIKVPIDVHLMIRPVCHRLIFDFIKAGANCIIFHPEVSSNIKDSLLFIKSHSCKAGLAFHPDISLDVLERFIFDVDVVLLLSVYPGFSNQSFIVSMFEKIKKARVLIDKYDLDVSVIVDGGIKIDNVVKVASCGADMFVIGSAIFDEEDYSCVINKFRSKLNKYFVCI
ncbi:MAG: ribulose-phosphate 3-epimerase [Candidatus Westeberhardia cardiocondylae]|nr:ribulose-phosphate 3-epimerase [Candidatus Westeberhardia cardiocondylae]